MLSHFEQILKNHKILVSYNGDTFDIPYLLKKMEQFDVDTTLDNIQSVDIYRTTRKYKKLLRLDSAKQFDIEHLIDFQRNTFISGGDLISAYKHYLNSHDESLLDDMLTHNHDDIRGLPAYVPCLWSLMSPRSWSVDLCLYASLRGAS